MSTKLWLVRHGEAAAPWDADPDPHLSGAGRAQALALADRLAPIGPLPIRTSPLRRCRETAEPLAARWGVVPIVDPAAGELPSPPGVPLAERGAWLRELFVGDWPAATAMVGGDGLPAWRRSVLDGLAAIEHDSVVFTHFVAINVVLGEAAGDDRVVCSRVANCGVAVVDVSAGGIHLVEAPLEIVTEVL